MPAWNAQQLHRFEEICGLIAAGLAGRAPVPSSAAAPVAVTAEDAFSPARAPAITAMVVIPPEPAPVDYTLKSELFFADVPWDGRPASPPAAAALAAAGNDDDRLTETFLGEAAWDAVPPVVPATRSALTAAAQPRHAPAPSALLSPPAVTVHTVPASAEPVAPQVPAHRNLLVAGLFSAAATSRRFLANLNRPPDQARRFFAEAQWNPPASEKN